MSSDQWIAVRLELDRDAEPITGTLTQGDEEARPFTGWLGLTDAIEAIRTAPPDAGSGAEEHEGHR